MAAKSPPSSTQPNSTRVQLKLLADELSCREFVPTIQRILWVSGNSEPSKWRVETDRGETEFVLNDEKDIRRLGHAWRADHRCPRHPISHPRRPPTRSLRAPLDRVVYNLKPSSFFVTLFFVRSDKK